MNDNLASKDEPCREPWREELIAGKLVAMAPAVLNHNRVKRNITGLLDTYLSGRECEALPDGTAVFLSETDYYFPDAMVVCDPEKLKWDGVHGAPDLVAEVLSPSTMKNDRGRKMRVYEFCGVREYWLVNPKEKSLEHYVLSDGRFELAGIYLLYSPSDLETLTEDDKAAIQTEFKCSLYDDLTIRLEDVFRRVP